MPSQLPAQYLSSAHSGSSGPRKTYCPCDQCTSLGGRHQSAKTIKRHMQKQALRNRWRKGNEREFRHDDLTTSEHTSKFGSVSSTDISTSQIQPVPKEDRRNGVYDNDPEADVDMMADSNDQPSGDPMDSDDDDMYTDPGNYDWVDPPFHPHSLSPSGSTNLADFPEVEPDSDSSYCNDSDDEEAAYEMFLDSDQGSIGSEDGDGLVIQQDPDFVPRENLYEPEDSPDPEDPFYEDEPELPPAFYENPTLRNIYIRTYIQAAVHHSTHESIKFQLDSDYASLRSLERHHQIAIPGLDKMACTLPTVERRLGLALNQYIKYYFLCPLCWHLYEPEELSTLESNACIEEFCEGVIFLIKKLTRGRKRVPMKILPVCPIIPQIQRMLLRPGKAAEFQHWRRPGDEEALIPPLNVPGRDAFPDPHQPLRDISDGWAWRAAQAGLDRRNCGQWGIQDVDFLNVNQRFVSLPLGLMLMINVDWFSSPKSGKHSSGAVYISICNNPRAKRFKREETILACVIPGPSEPSLEQMNSCLVPFVCDISRLSEGVDFRVYGEPGPHVAHCHVHINSSDLPASRKLSGLRGVTCKRFMCTRCTKTLASLTNPACFDPDTFVMRDDWRFLKYSFRARDSTPAERNEIANKHGTRWSVLNELPGWLPAVNSPLEFMHAIFLGEVKHVMQNILIRGGMLTARSKKDKPALRLQDFLESLQWPASVSRVPSKVSEGGLKADHWRNLVTVMPVALYVAWQIDGEIPDMDAPRAKSKTKASKSEARVESLLAGRRREDLADNDDADAEDYEQSRTLKMNRNYRQHYGNVLDHCTSIRLWATRTITPDEARRAQNYHGLACRSWAEMNCHLTPVFHLSEHNEELILRYGPVYGWWGYAMERNNGFLKKFNHNGHSGGELEATMMRGWLKWSLVSDLLLHMRAVEDPDDDDIEIIKLIREYLASQSKGRRRRGNIMDLIEDREHAAVQHASHMRTIDLHALGLYDLVYNYLCDLWAQEVDLVPDTAWAHEGEPFLVNAVRTLDFVTVNGLRYGVANKHRGEGYCHAYIYGRHPIRIKHVMHVKFLRRNCNLPPLEHTFACVKPFQAPVEDMPLMPWQRHALDLGIGMWTRGVFEPALIVPVAAFSGHFVRGLIPYRDKTFWVTMSLCHLTQEPYDDIDELFMADPEEPAYDDGNDHRDDEWW